MSNTKGSMLISNANAVGTELVNQLGGTGYKPSEWSDAINLLGISDDDKASALAGITEGTYTGTERGAIKYSNCNAVGAMLNKKFSTNRGFKPVEWESAISKLTPLAEGTVSGAICNIVNGADGVPVKNWLVTLPASLDGYTEVNGTKIESNNLLGFGSVDFTLKGVRFYTVDGVLYLDGSTVGEISSIDNAFKTNLRFYLPAGTYYFNRGSIALPTYIYDVDNMTSGNAIRTNNGSFTLAEGKTLALGFYLYQKTFSTEKLDACVNIGSTAITYEDTAAPTQYTASLGRTIYGGQADIVTGEGEATYKGFNLGALTWSGGIIGGQMWCWYVDLSAEGLKLPANSAIFDGICDNYTPIRYNGISSNANTIALRNNGYLYVNNGSDTIQPTGKVTIALDTADAFTFTPITPTPETALGVNNFWCKHGDSSITYRKDPDIPDPPVQLLNMNNNENNNNEGV